eukprot:CAMPEP_0197654782 /NCGR_PEP_ID=MMETSP1338-20131121/39052_1 /TAXON_ID=43686 ORGANISM="Pelagodinium beii, Strain RCC1491" /NCGR_SAMPLE_ID=MMETSP1338 /ASSEMBLY_ACC=CAM_ASM_000754 /LENGTH=483 /DNA_ID=CAMNT_0043230287 /DNA_START=63 /DNA_END=1514 /DNA_ORIENTATION=-
MKRLLRIAALEALVVVTALRHQVVKPPATAKVGDPVYDADIMKEADQAEQEAEEAADAAEKAFNGEASLAVGASEEASWATEKAVNGEAELSAGLTEKLRQEMYSLLKEEAVMSYGEFESSCEAHLHKLNKLLGDTYGDVQVRNVLIHECSLDKQFPHAIDAGFSEHKECLKFANRFPEAVKKERAGKHGFKEFCEDFYAKATAENAKSEEAEPEEESDSSESAEESSETSESKEDEKPSKEGKKDKKEKPSAEKKKPSEQPKVDIPLTKDKAKTAKESPKKPSASTSLPPVAVPLPAGTPVYSAPKVDLGPGCKDCRKPSLLDELWDWLFGNGKSAAPAPAPEPKQEPAKKTEKVEEEEVTQVSDSDWEHLKDMLKKSSSAAGSSSEQKSYVSVCVDHLKKVARVIDHSYTDEQAEAALETQCNLDKEFSAIREESFEQHKECKIFAKLFTKARQEDLEGDESRYSLLCNWYYAYSLQVFDK